MTALADAYARAHAQAPGAKPKAAKSYKLDTKGRLKISRPKVQDHSGFIAAMLARAALHDQESAQEHHPDLHFGAAVDPNYRNSKAVLVSWIKPKPGFKVTPILSTTRLTRPGPGDHTQRFAKTAHGCDFSSLKPETSHNYVPERPKTSKAVLVRKLMHARKK